MANLSMARLFGYSSPEELLSTVTDIGEQLYADPADREKMSRLLLDNDHLENFEVKLLTKNKDIIWGNGKHTHREGRKGIIRYFEGTIKDVTERKKAEEELVLAQRKFQEIFDNTADGIYQSTVEGRFIMANASMARIFGYDSTDDLIHSVTDITTQIYANPEERKKMSSQLLREGHVRDYEIQVLTKSKILFG